MQVTIEIEETKNNTMSKMSQQEERVEEIKNLGYCVNIILKKEILRINGTQAKAIIENDLGITLKNTSALMQNVIGECLCYYLKKWSGWDKTYEAKFVCTNKAEMIHYNRKIKQYLRFKLLYIMENEDKFILKDNAMNSKEVQTESINHIETNKLEAPYQIVIEGQPYYLNTVGFREDCNNVLVQQHPARYLPVTVSHRDFLNYPFIEVTVNLPGMEISRNNSHEYIRYISEHGSPECPKYNFLDFVRKINTVDGVKVYTLDYIMAYFKQFIEILEKQPAIKPNKVTELRDIFIEFVEDIKESDLHTFKPPLGAAIHTMGTNISVRYNIGREAYFRNKIMSDNSSGGRLGMINFTEILIPRITYSLTKFIAEEDPETAATTFKGLNMMDIASGDLDGYRIAEALGNSVIYNCKLCGFVSRGLYGFDDIFFHYEKVHMSEEPVACFKCKTVYTVPSLAANRWKHNCSKTNPPQNQRQFAESQPIINNKNNSVAPKNITNNIINNTISNTVINYCPCSATKNVESCVISNNVSNKASLNSVPVHNLIHRSLPLLNGSFGTKNIMNSNTMSTNCTYNPHIGGLSAIVNSVPVNNMMHRPPSLLNGSFGTKNIMNGNTTSTNRPYNPPIGSLSASLNSVPVNNMMHRPPQLLNGSFGTKNIMNNNTMSTNCPYNPPIGSLSASLNSVPVNNMMHRPPQLLNGSFGTKNTMNSNISANGTYNPPIGYFH